LVCGLRQRFKIVEGNRRLVALKGLSDTSLREELEQQTPGWRALGTIAADSAVPVVVVTDRVQVDAILGFRHISGIEPWDPFAQSRFITELVERTGDFSEVAEIVGRKESEVRSMFRDHDIVQQAKTEFELDTSRVEKSFGVFNAAMGLVKLRDYIGAPAPRFVDPEIYPVPDDNKQHVRRLFEYLYGDERGRGRVITDSRQLKQLAKVLSDESGAAERTLRQSRDLQVALEATVSHQEGASSALQRARRALETARTHIATDGFNPETLEPLVRDCREALDEVEALTRRSDA
jgi:hypothetical protein